MAVKTFGKKNRATQVFLLAILVRLSVHFCFARGSFVFAFTSHFSNYSGPLLTLAPPYKLVTWSTTMS